ncbi:MAG: hypothetical protein Kilf2KO_14180 [Rhodospirillales bacterium]
MKCLLPPLLTVLLTVGAQAADGPPCLEDDSGGPLETCIRDARAGDLRPAAPAAKPQGRAD